MAQNPKIRRPMARFSQPKHDVFRRLCTSLERVREQLDRARAALGGSP
jgi:hypothetical protein